MPLPQRFHVRCFDPTRRWTGRLRAALDATIWRVVTVDTFAELLENPINSDGVLPSPWRSPPALLLCVLDENTAADAARWWSLHREQAHPRSPLIVVASPTEDAGLLAYWQELGAAAVFTTTLELTLVIQLAERFAANPENRAPDAAHPLAPFWQALPWADALPKAGPAR